MNSELELYNISAIACLNVYDRNIKLSVGTEYNCCIRTINGKRFQIIAIAGTNDCFDWLKNLNLLSWNGIKLSAYLSAKRIWKHAKIHKSLPVIVTGHSMGGAVAIAIKRLYNVNYCVAFAPARSVRYWINRRTPNTTIFIDPDDPVSKAGCISFGHPECKVIKSPENHFTYSSEDHKIKNWVEFTGKNIMNGSD